MSSHLCHVYALSCLFIGVVLCHSASLSKLRVGRDTRNIPSNMFKPLDSNSNKKENTTWQDNSYDNNSFYEQSSSRARPVPGFSPSKRTQFLEDSSAPDEDSFSNRFSGPQRDSFSSSFRTPEERVIRGPFGNLYSPTGFHRVSNTGSSFGSSSFGSTPLMSQSAPFIPTAIGPSSGFSGFGSGLQPNNFGGGSSNNYHRSESYSYTSDGNGPPQIEQSVYDSRLGYGISNRKF